MRMIALASVCLVSLGLSTPASAQHGLLQRNFDNYGYQTTEELDIAAIANVGGGNCAREDARATIRECTRLLNDRQAINDARNARQRRAIWFTLRANAHAELGDLDRAEDDYRRAITSYPNGLWIYVSRAITYETVANYEMVLDSLYQGEEIAPDSSDMLGWIAWYLATAPDASMRDGPEALAKAQRAIELTTDNPAIHVDTLAAAYAETGDFARAVEEQRRAIGLLSGEDAAMLPDFEQRLALYMQGIPARLAPASDS